MPVRRIADGTRAMGPEQGRRPLFPGPKKKEGGTRAAFRPFTRKDQNSFGPDSPHQVAEHLFLLVDPALELLLIDGAETHQTEV